MNDLRQAGSSSFYRQSSIRKELEGVSSGTIQCVVGFRGFPKPISQTDLVCVSRFHNFDNSSLFQSRDDPVNPQLAQSSLLDYRAFVDTCRHGMRGTSSTFFSSGLEVFINTGQVTLEEMEL